MGGFAKKIVDNFIDPVTGLVNKAIKPIEKLLNKVAEFTDNVIKGLIRNIKGIFKGIFKGDWTTFRDSLVGVVTTVIYVVAGVAAGIAGQWYITAAAIVALDGQYNQGQLTNYVVTQIGKVEKTLFGSEYILDNVDLITTSIIMVGSVSAGVYGTNILANATGVASYLASPYVTTALGAYSVYDAYTQWQEATELYNKLMEDYQKWLREATARIELFNRMWDAVYGDISVWYSAMPGGYLFNAGVGSDEYSISDINEQCEYCLALHTKKDRNFEDLNLRPSEVDFVGLNFDDIKPEILRYKD